MDFGLNQTLTYWEPGVPDGFGRLDFSAVTRVDLPCRWEEKAVQFRDIEGTLQVSRAVVYLEDPVVLGGYVALGAGAGVAGADPRDAGASEIRYIGTSPSLQADETLYKVML